ncbi:MAG: hypothetical protein HWN65_14340 [Candidatus Helarchaeota archaeon]|nr:hypothetical protein [Candidatus Helarchaeota archaeon]
MYRIICERCGAENEVDNKNIILHKCPTCMNIKFDRGLLGPLEKQVIKNFKLIKALKFGKILKNLYIFGDYAEGKPKCRDINFLVINDLQKLERLIRSEMKKFPRQFDSLDWGFSISKFKAILEKSFWDFRICQDYPECLDCFYGEEDTCEFRMDDYSSYQHNYCLDKCSEEKKNPIPRCCRTHCTLLHPNLYAYILKEIFTPLKEGIEEYWQDKSSGLKVKVIVFVRKESIKELEDEFEKKSLTLYKIDYMNGTKKCIRRKKL